MSRQKPEVIIEDGEGRELGRGTLVGMIEDGDAVAVFLHLPEQEELQ